MAERDQFVAQVLERWRVQDEAPAWDEVLARAGLAEPTRRRPGSKRLYASLLAAGVVAIAAPAFAIVARHLLTARPVPGTTTTTHVELGPGRSAELRLRSSGSPLARGSAGFRFLRAGPGQARTFRWTLELHGLDQVGGARITLHGQAIRLCKQCSNGGGLFVLRDREALGLLNGQATLTVGQARHRVALAAGGRLTRARPASP
jgi:hypothetical protein